MEFKKLVTTPIPEIFQEYIRRGNEIKKEIQKYGQFVIDFPTPSSDADATDWEGWIIKLKSILNAKEEEQRLEQEAIAREEEIRKLENLNDTIKAEIYDAITKLHNNGHYRQIIVHYQGSQYMATSIFVRTKNLENSIAEMKPIEDGILENQKTLIIAIMGDDFAISYFALETNGIRNGTVVPKPIDENEEKMIEINVTQTEGNVWKINHVKVIEFE